MVAKSLRAEPESHPRPAGERPAKGYPPVVEEGQANPWCGRASSVGSFWTGVATPTVWFGPIRGLSQAGFSRIGDQCI